MIAPAKTRPTLLLTRPEQAALRFRAQFWARFGEDWPVVLAPLMHIVTCHPSLPAADAVIFTSQNAIAPFVNLSPAAGRVAFCVGQKTAQVARDAGFTVVEGPGDARALVPVIQAQHTGGLLLHARGQEVAVRLAEMLNSAGIETKDAVLYAQKPCPLTAEARVLLARPAPVLLPLFSPRSAELMVQAAAGVIAPLWIAPISPAVAQVSHGLAPARVDLADKPDAGSVLDALARLAGLENAG
ncbi:MAG: uroporphyrinogen-III synthase [Paracoccaceae bacterium]|nr:uroporphyrinogen-III synthase [Paracoccaceae bacterium]